MSDGNRPATCHPDRPHHADGKCMPCYGREYHEKVRKPRKAAPKPRRRKTVGTVPTTVRGWGYLG